MKANSAVYIKAAHGTNMSIIGGVLNNRWRGMMSNVGGSSSGTVISNISAGDSASHVAISVVGRYETIMSSIGDADFRHAIGSVG